jgi:hypothetical protein
MTLSPIGGAASILLAATVATSFPASAQEKHTESLIDSRLVLSFKANAGEVQKLLPDGWQVTPGASGPSKDANIIVTFVDRLLIQTPDGKAAETPTYRVVAFAIPARNPQTGESGPVLVRILSTGPTPGFYKTAVPATIQREITATGGGTTAGSANERWEAKDEKGGSLQLHIAYERATPVRSKAESRPRSGLDPKIWRIYRFEQTTDAVKSVADGVDRVKSYRLRSNLAEFAKVLDGSEQLVGVTSVPMYARQTFVPEL